MYLEIQNVKKSYGQGGSYIQVLKGVNTGVEKGQMCVIQGTSGSGKSTLLNCIGGLDTMDSGSIKVDGTEIFGMKNNALADYRREHPSTVVVRSVRNAGEAELEIRTAAINRRLFPGAETLLIPASADLADISSSAVREIAGFGGDIREFVPKSVYREIMKYIASERSK